MAPNPSNSSNLEQLKSTVAVYRETERIRGRTAEVCRSNCRWRGCAGSVLLVWTEAEGLLCSHSARMWCRFADIYKHTQWMQLTCNMQKDKGHWWQWGKDRKMFATSVTPWFITKESNQRANERRKEAWLAKGNVIRLDDKKNRVSNRSAGMISGRFPGDIFTKIQQNLQFYRHLLGRITNPCDHNDPVYRSNSSVKGHLPGIDSPNIN